MIIITRARMRTTMAMPICGQGRPLGGPQSTPTAAGCPLLAAPILLITLCLLCLHCFAHIMPIIMMMLWSYNAFYFDDSMPTTPIGMIILLVLWSCYAYIMPMVLVIRCLLCLLLWWYDDDIIPFMLMILCILCLLLWSYYDHIMIISLIIWCLLCLLLWS